MAGTPRVVDARGSVRSYTAPAGGVHVLKLADVDSYISVFDNNVIVASQPDDLTTSISITGSDGGSNSFEIPLGLSYTGPITVTDPTGLGVMTVQGSGTGNAISLTSGEIDQDGVSLQYAGISSLDLSLAGVQNNVSIQGANVPTSIESSSNSDAFAVSGMLDAPVSLSGGGTSRLTLKDSAARATLTGSTLSRDGSSTISYSGFATITWDASGGGESISVLGTSRETATTIDLGSTTSHVVIGSTLLGSGGTLDGIQGSLQLVDASLSTLSIDASGDASNLSGSLSSALLTGLGLGANLSFDPLASLALTLGSGNDNLSLMGEAAAAVSLDGGNGNDALSINLDW